MSPDETAARTEAQVRQELDKAYQLDRKLRLGTPEYRENRQRIGQLVDELQGFRVPPTGAFSCEDYTAWPDTFEQSAQTRARRRAC